MCLTQAKDQATSVKKAQRPTKNDGGSTKHKENTSKGTQAKMSKKCIKKNNKKNNTY